MKKLILLLLLPILAIGQTSTGKEQIFLNGVRNKAPQTITTPTYLATAGTDGTLGVIPSAYIEKTANKQNSLATDGTGTKYPTLDAVNDAFATINANNGDDITALLQGTINSLKLVSIKKSGTYLISSSILMPSNSSLYLASGVVLKLANGSNCEIVRNSDVSSGNENIKIYGEGKFDCNGVNQSNSGSSPTNPNQYQMTGILFKNCNNIRIEGITVKDPKWFGIQLGKVTNFIVKDITFDYPLSGGDGLHINGQCHYGYVENLKSPYNITRDDLFAIVAKDTPMFNIYEGSITNIKCNGISALNSYNAVRIISAGYEVSDISINDISGTYQASCVNIDDFRDYISQVGEGIIKNVTISNVRANVPTNVHGLIRLAAKIQSINFNNITRIETGVYAVPTFKFDLYADVDLISINGVQIDDYTTQSVNGNTGIRIANNAVVKTMMINNYSHKYLGTNTYDNRGFFLFLDNSGIDNLILSNINIDKLTTPILLSTSSIKKLSMSNFSFNEVLNLIKVNIEAGQISDIPVINLANGFFKAISQTTELFGFSYTLSNKVNISTLNFKVYSFTGNPIYVDPGNGIQVSLNSKDISVNPTYSTSILTPNKDDVIVRKGESLAQNNVLCVYDGLNFIPVSTGANYSDNYPSTGTYARGDRVLNYLPWIGQPVSWICTASGTPGTWVSEGNLNPNNFTGSGTTDYLPKFTGTNALGNSLISDNGTIVTVNSPIKVAGGGASSLATSVSSAGFNMDYQNNPGLGLFMGSISFGGGVKKYIQSANSAGTSSYPLFLNPYGGNVIAGIDIDNGVDKFQVNGSISATSFNGGATLTGTPTAPTATVGTNTTQIATTAFVQSTTNTNTVLLTGNQTIAGVKTFTNNTTSPANNGIILSNSNSTGSGASPLVITNTGSADGAYIRNTAGGKGIDISNESSGVGFYVINDGGSGSGFLVEGYSGSTGDLYKGNKQGAGTVFNVDKDGKLTAASIIKTGGTSSQFLKADGSVDTNNYVTSASGVIAGSFTATGTATTTFTVTIGTTQANNTYRVVATGSNAMSAASFFISNKTTTTFDVSYLTALTGAIAFDWILKP